MASKYSDDEYDEDIGMWVGNPLKYENYKETEEKEEEEKETQKKTEYETSYHSPKIG